jgi:hypothetical protein
MNENDRTRALLELVAVLDDIGAPYIVTGDLAFVHWGMDRAIESIEVGVGVAGGDRSNVAGRLLVRFDYRTGRSAELFEKHRILQLKDRRGVAADVRFLILDYEKEAVRRGVAVEFGDAPVKFCTAEDLIIFKLASPSEADRNDARALFRSGKGELDLAHLEPIVLGVAGMMEYPDLWEFWREVKRAAGKPN